MTAHRRHQADSVRFFVPDDDRRRLAHHPWHTPLDRWGAKDRVHLLAVKSGVSRHVVRFVEAGGERYAVKETTVESARREEALYRALRMRGIPSLDPVGVVVRDDGRVPVATPVGTQVERRETGFLVTRLHDKVVPDSYLFRRGFSRENRNRIRDAVVSLFVLLHAEGVCWGDASLANMLIHFSTEPVPLLGQRTRLRAVLADAETVEIRTSLSVAKRRDEVEFFLESMLWTEADLQASGIVRGPIVTQEDQQYVRDRYMEHFALEQEMRSFELMTRIDVDTLPGSFDVQGYGTLLLRHIQEHRWYLGERRGAPVDLTDAAEDWYATVFRPVCRLFQQHNLPALFPKNTAASLYVQVMEHRYFMSRERGTDVGLAAALQDYIHRFAPLRRPAFSLSALVEGLATLFRGGHHPLFR